MTKKLTFRKFGQINIFSVVYGFMYFYCYICNQFGHIKLKNMKVISMRDFRNEQTKYLKMAKKGEDIILKSRSEGSFRLKPITDNDSLMTKEEFYAKIKNGLKQIENGEVYDMLPNETTDEFIDRLLCIE